MEEEGNLDKWLSLYKYPLALGIVGLVLIIGGMISSGNLKIFKTASPTKAQTGTIQNSGLIVVDVLGAVQNPGVYKLPQGSRIEEAIQKAGGVTGDADQDYLTKKLNLAQKLSDGMKVYIPDIRAQKMILAQEEGKNFTSLVNSAVAGLSEDTNSELININEASPEVLDSLPGVGPVSAQNIISKRPYSSIEELLSKKAVNKSVFEKIKEDVSVY